MPFRDVFTQLAPMGESFHFKKFPIETFVNDTE